MSGYTPKRYAGTTAKQRFGVSATVSQDAQHRTPDGREKAKVEKMKAGGPAPTPATTDKDTGKKVRTMPLAPEQGDLLEGVVGVDMSGAAMGPFKLPTTKVSKADTLPTVSILPTKELMAEAVRLMEDDVEYAEMERAAVGARKGIKARLVEIARENGLADGMRWGTIAAYITRGKTRRTFDAALAVENGLAAEAVPLCYKVSAPWDEVRVVDLSWPARKGGGEDGE